MTRKHTVAGRGGFTVVEIFVAMAILSLSMVTTIGLMKTIMRGTDYSARMTLAIAAAEQKIESLLESGYSAISSGSDSTNGISRSWSSTVSGGVKQVTVTSSWTAMDGSTKTVSVKGMVAP